MTQEQSAAPLTQSAGDPALDALEVRLAAAQRAEAERQARDKAPLRDDAKTIGLQVASTLVGYPIGGIVIGFFFDQVFGTRPWIMLGLMFAAFAAAVLQIFRTNQNRAD